MPGKSRSHFFWFCPMLELVLFQARLCDGLACDLDGFEGVQIGIHGSCYLNEEKGDFIERINAILVVVLSLYFVLLLVLLLVAVLLYLYMGSSTPSACIQCNIGLSKKNKPLQKMVEALSNKKGTEQQEGNTSKTSNSKDAASPRFAKFLPKMIFNFSLLFI